MTRTQPRELTRPGRLADLAHRAVPPRWRLYVTTCDPTEVSRAILTVRAAADRDTGPLRVGTAQHQGISPSLVARQLAGMRDDVAAGRVAGVSLVDSTKAITNMTGRTDELIDSLLAGQQANPELWLIVIATRVLSTQCAHTAWLS